MQQVTEIYGGEGGWVALAYQNQSFLLNHLGPSCYLVFPVVRVVLW